MSNDLVSRLRDYRIWNRAHHRYDAVPVVQEAATALTEARASAAHWRRAVEIIATIIGLPEPEANFASKVRDAFDELRSQLHDANGVAELAIKHRDAAESELATLRAELDASNVNHRQMATAMADLARKHATLRARVREVVGPFAKAGELFGPRLSDEYDQCIYSPAAGDEYSLCGDHLRTARQLMEDLK